MRAAEKISFLGVQSKEAEARLKALQEVLREKEVMSAVKRFNARYAHSVRLGRSSGGLRSVLVLGGSKPFRVLSRTLTRRATPDLCLNLER